jgi:hypothetical protein
MYYLSKIVYSTIIFTILISILIILGIFFISKEVKSANIQMLNTNFQELSVIIGKNNKDGRFITYHYEFNE